MTKRSLFARLGLLIIVVSACGGGDDAEGTDGGAEERAGLSAAEQAYADAFAATLQDDEDGLSVEAGEAACMGEAIMAELGVEPFEEAGVEADAIKPGADVTSPGELLGDGVVSQAQADRIIAAWGDDCVDLVDVLVASAGSEMDLDSEGKACLTDGLEAGGLAARVMTGAFTSADGSPSEDVIADFLALLEECGTPEGGSGPLVASIAESLAADGSMTDEQAACLAQGVVDTLGVERLSEMFSTGKLDDLDDTGQSEVTGALFQAAVACDVPLEALGG